MTYRHIPQAELQEILAKHQKWLNNEEGGERADLSYSDLSYSDLSDSNLSDSNLSYSNLSGSNLSDSNLSDSNLSDSNLSDSNLSGSNLSDSNLSYSNLSGSNLRGSNLSGSNLRGSTFWGCIGNRQQIKSMFVSSVYPITYTSEYLQIGCERHPIADWWEFDDRRILEMDGRGALEFWMLWKNIIRTVIETSPAEKTGKEEAREAAETTAEAV